MGSENDCSLTHRCRICACGDSSSRYCSPSKVHHISFFSGDRHHRLCPSSASLKGARRLLRPRPGASNEKRMGEGWNSNQSVSKSPVHVPGIDNPLIRHLALHYVLKTCHAAVRLQTLCIVEPPSTTATAAERTEGVRRAPAPCS